MLNVVDGCIPSDLGVGTSAEIEEERRRLYVAMTRAKTICILPQRFFTRGQTALGDRHAYARAHASFPTSSCPISNARAGHRHPWMVPQAAPRPRTDDQYSSANAGDVALSR